MKRIFLLSAAFFSCFILHAQLYQQTFSTDVATVSNGVIADANYVSATPSSSQLTYLGAPTSGTIGVSGGTLNITTSSTSSRWAAVRNVDFTPTPTNLKIQFDANITVGSSGSSGSKFAFYVGSGFTNGTSVEATYHSGFGIKYQNSAYFYFSDAAGGNVIATQYAEGTNRTFTLYINNSGATITYTAPDGNMETVANDTWDLWVTTGTTYTKIYNDLAASSATTDLKQIKFGDVIANNGRADMVIDNITVDPIIIPAPVSLGALNAVAANNSIKLNWSSFTETNMDRYEVEKSSDGRSFTAITSVVAKNSGSIKADYNCTDAVPFAGTNFYRIKAIEKNGSVKYTSIVKISMQKTKQELNITPNPVTGNQINLQFSGFSKGEYKVSLLNSNGQVVFTKGVNVEAGSTNQSLSLPPSVQKGTYYLQLVNGESKISKQVLIQ